MPNHVFNEVRLHGVSLETVVPLITDKKGKISFAVLVPLPINFWPGSVGSQHEKAFPGTHLDAARKTWGTKWNCYGYPKAVQDGDDTLITFQTAWEPPRGWIVALFNTLECRITAKWMSEGQSDAFTETYFMDDTRFGGPGWETETHIEGSDEQRRLHKCLWGVEVFEDEDEEA